MQEVMADFMGAKVLGLYLKGKKLDQEARQAAVGFFVSDACQSGDNQKAPDTTKPTLAKSLNWIFEDYYASLDAHPIAINRYSRNFYVLHPYNSWTPPQVIFPKGGSKDGIRIITCSAHGFAFKL